MEYRPFDYYGSLVALRACLRDMEKFQAAETVFVSVGRDKDCEHMRTVTKALDRLIEDDYYLTPNYKEQQDLDLEIVADFVKNQWLSCWS